MSLAKLFYMKETFRESVRRWRQACFRKRSHVRREQRFVLEALEQRVLLAATPAALVQGAIEVPGEVDQYSFHVDAPANLYVDSLTNNSQIAWSLNGPRGPEVNQQAFSSGDRLLGLLPTGDYILAVDGSGDATGSYAFRLVDLDSATSVTLGTPVSGTLDSELSSLTRVPSTAPLTYPGGTPNSAVTFSGQGEHITVADAADLRPAQLTVEAWLKPDPTIGAYSPALMKSTTANTWNDGYGLQMNSDGTQISFFVNNYSSGSISVALTKGSWSHVAGTYDGATLKLYLNGELAASRAYTTPITHSTAPLWIGAGPGSYAWKGDADDVRVWNVVRSATQIAAAFGGPLTGSEPGLVGYWPLDEASGATVTDATGQGHTGSGRAGRATDLYQFTAQAGDRLYFDQQALTNYVYPPTWRLLNPYGVEVFNQSFSDVDVRTLGHTGTYTLLVEASINDSADTMPSYTFTVQPVVDDQAALTLGASQGVGPVWTTGQRAGAVQFTGSDWGEVPYSASIDLRNSATIELWFKVDQMTPVYMPLLTKGSDLGTNRTYSLWVDSTARTVAMSLGNYTGNGPTLVSAPGSIEVGEWYHMAGVINRTSGALQLYLNGVLDASGTVATTPGPSYTRPLLIGRTFEQLSTFVNFEGAIDDVRLWNVARTQADIQATMNQEVTGAEAGLVLALPLNEGTGRTVQDQTANHNNGQLKSLFDGATGVVGGRIAHAGQQDRYTFTLSQATSLYFDSLTNNGNFRWTLTGPRGTEVNARSFQGDVTLGLLPAGNYQLLVDGVGATTGGYGFRLLDLATATTITLGTPVSGTLVTRGTAAYQFTATAGDRFYFDQQVLSGQSSTPRWRLLNPYGAEVFNQSFSDVDVRTLGQTGTYLLLVEASISDPVGTTPSYTFTVVPVVDTAQTLDFDTTITATLGVGQKHIYTVTAASPSLVYFDALTSNPNFTITFAEPGDPSPIGQSFNSDDFGMMPAGTLSITVDGTGVAAGTYSFRLLNLATAAPLSLPLAVPVSGTLTPGTRTNLYRFTATAGDKFTFDAQTLSGGTATWTLIDPYGAQVFTAGFPTDQANVTLDFTGTYTLAIRGNIANPNPGNVTYTFNMQSLGNTPPATITGTPVVFGNTMSGNLSLAGQVDFYTLSVATDTVLSFDGLTNNSLLRWAIFGPSIDATNQSFSTEGPIRQGVQNTLPAGDYVFALSASSGTPGAYSFRLITAATATQLSLPASGELATPVSGQLSPGNKTDLYRFDATVGDRFFFDAVSVSGGSTSWRLVSPTGHDVFSSSLADVDTIALPMTGTYVLAIGGALSNTAPVNYSIRVQPVGENVATLALGATTTGSITVPGEQDRYTFTLGQTSQLYFDSLTNSSSMTWTLTGPRGTEVNGPPFYSSDLVLGQLPAGSYELTVDGTGTTTGAYSFRLLDLANATALTLGTPVSGTLLNRGTAAYQFTATAGDRVYFDQQALSGQYYQPSWRLLDPNGREVFNQGFSDLDVTTLGQTGTYTLLVEAVYYDQNGATPNYTFNVNQVSVSAPIPLVGIGGPQGPDLSVANVTLTPGAGLQSGATVTVSWNDRNTGTQATTGSWQDRLVVRNVATSEILNVATVLYDSTVDGSILPGEVRGRQATVTLPQAVRGSGTLSFTVTTDVENALPEVNAGGTGESNNSTAITVVSVLASYPDLQISNVSVDPSTGWIAGSNVAIHWRVTNTGTQATNRSFSDQVQIRNLATNQTVFVQTAQYDEALAGNGPIQSGEFRDRTLNAVWPSGASTSGQFEFRITTDSGNVLFEENAAGTGETNNQASLTITSAADLQVSNLRVSPQIIVAGSTMTIEWDDRNGGIVATPSGWSDHLVIVNTTTGETILDTAVVYNQGQSGAGAIGAGGTLPRSMTFTIPPGLRGTGDLRITVTADQNISGQGSLFETNEANNSTAITVHSFAQVYPDLLVMSFTAPASGRGGEQIEVSWTATNLSTAAANAPWTDRVILSRDTIIGNGDDITLGEFPQLGSLIQGATYSKT